MYIYMLFLKQYLFALLNLIALYSYLCIWVNRCSISVKLSTSKAQTVDFLSMATLCVKKKKLKMFHLTWLSSFNMVVLKSNYKKSIISIVVIESLCSS